MKGIVCALSSPRPQPGHEDLGKSLEVNVAKGHSAQHRCRFCSLSWRKAKHKELLQQELLSPHLAWSIWFLPFLQEESNRFKTHLVSGITEVKQTQNIRKNFSIQITVSFLNGLI